MDPVSLLLSLPADLEAWLILGYVIVGPGRSAAVRGAGPGPLRAAQAVCRARLRVRRRWRPLPVPAGGAARPASVEPKAGWRFTGRTGVELQRLPLEGVLHAARRGPTHLPPPGGLGRNGHRTVSLATVAADVRGGGGSSVVGLVRWRGQPGTGLLLVALAASLASVAQKLLATWKVPGLDVDTSADGI